MAALLAVKFQSSPSVPHVAETMAPPSVGGTPAQGTHGTLAGAGRASAGRASAGRAAGNAALAPSGAAKSQAGTKPSATAKPSGTGQAATTRVITGSVASTAYGPMQAQITVTGGRITKVAVLQQTDVGSYSSQVDSVAIPQLTRETLSAQSAKIDAVSGASYTSQGYIQSLQSALDQPGA
jgi:uncharacterized protein with FMN-binding domain